MKRLLGRYFFAHLLLTFLAFNLALWAQSDRASIVGSVSDTSGALVSGAKVKVTNEATGASFEATTDDGGRYVTPNILRPGTYKVEVSRDGFKSKVTSGVLLQIGDVKQVNVTLEVGAAGETITVTSEAPQLETETSNRGEVITGRQVTELPLKDRNFTNLALLTPGVSRALTGNLTSQFTFNQGDPNAGGVPGLGDNRGGTEGARFSRSGGASISANGLRPTNNNFSLDGADNNEPQFGTIGVFPNPDAIAEFKVETSVGKAETGRGGATVNATYESGTNSFHGKVYYYGQNDALNATHAEILRKRSLLTGLTEAEREARLPKSKIRVHEFGFTFGGPLIKNRTFFFGDYLGQRNSLPIVFQTSVPTAASRAGDFSQDFVQFDNVTPCPAQGCMIDIFTGLPFTVPDNIAASYGGNVANHPFFSQQGFDYLNLFPLPNISGVLNPNGDTGAGRPNFVGTRGNQERIDAFDIKIDHRLTEKNNLSGRYSQNNQKSVRAPFFPNLPTPGFGAGDERGNTRQVVISDTHAFRPTLLNEARFGWTQIEISIFNCGVGGACGVSPTWCDDLNIPNCNTGTLADSGGILTGGSGRGFFEFTGDGGLFQVKSNNFFVADSVTVISGKHTWKAGVEVRPRYLDTLDGGRSGFLKGNIPFGDGGPLGNAQANILLGGTAPGNIPGARAFAGRGTIAPDANGEINPFALRATEWAFYVQDDWKVSPDLTLNLGVRYERFPAFSESDARLANYDVDARAIIRAADSSDSTIDTDSTNFGPRIGFAYAFGDERQFVLRGGYGLFYALDGVDYPPLVRNPPLSASVGCGDCASLTTGPPVAVITDPPVLTPGSALFVVPVDQKTATVHEWNLTFQWQFARDWLLDLGYAATRGRNLLATRQLGTALNGLGLARTPTTAPTPVPDQDLPYFNVGAYENRSGSNYDALQARVEKRFSHGILARMNYTWSHNIDDASGVFRSPGDVRDGCCVPTPINPLDHRRDRGKSGLDRRHLFTSNFIWDLPIGRGKSLGGDAGSGWDKVIGGWQLNGILSAQTGQPFSVFANNTVAVQISDPFSGVPAGRFFNPAAFAPASANPLSPGFAGTTCVTTLAPSQACFGNTGRNQFVGPGFFRTDLSFFKNTQVTESVKFQFGIEFSNIFNHYDRIVPAADANNPGNLGVFENALPPRTVQYRLKLLF